MKSLPLVDSVSGHPRPAPRVPGAAAARSFLPPTKAPTAPAGGLLAPGRGTFGRARGPCGQAPERHQPRCPAHTNTHMQARMQACSVQQASASGMRCMCMCVRAARPCGRWRGGLGGVGAAGGPGRGAQHVCAGCRRARLRAVGSLRRRPAPPPPPPPPHAAFLGAVARQRRQDDPARRRS
eukprot:scaffold1561_cov404-Prasinococcus_capsulatus_cf.AAC.10